MLFVAFFYYKNERNLYYDLVKSNMHNKTAMISAKIIYAHMVNEKFDVTNLLEDKDYQISLYSVEKKKIFGNLEDKIDFKKDYYRHNNHYILVDDSPLGHLGVFYIVIEENLFFKQVKALEINIFVFFLLMYSIISLIGFYLAKLFLKPIKEEREKLNNFIKDTTHELNTPISAILMSTESDVLSEKQVQRVRLSAKRVSEIYKDLTYIFLQDHENIKSLELINLKKIINEQLEYFKPLAHKKKISINLKIEDLFFKINKDDFIRLFNNIMSNAIKYNKMSGFINIEINNSVLSIEDNGIGISKDKLKDIYKRYYRATKEQGGFGIGLNIVNHICKTYQIKIEVKSKIKKGTTFILSFKN